jgi:hypothetical protein
MLRIISPAIIASLLFASLPVAAQEVRRLTAADLAIQTSKWNGKKIEVQLRCFFADSDEYRCAAGGARVDFVKIINSNGKTHVEENCDTLSKLARPDCVVIVRFVYAGFDTMRTPKRDELTVVIAKDFEGEVIPPEVRKKR